MFEKKFFILTVFFFLLIFIFLNFKLTEVPNGINGDEASIGYNAILISNTFRDENHRLLPLFILTLNQKDWKQPITLYSTTLAFKLFGTSFFILREVSVLFTLISAILLFILIYSLRDFKAAIVGTLLFVTTPIIIIQSHLALENIAPLPFILLWLINLNLYRVKQKRKYLFFSSIALFISFFSYNGMRLVIPVLLILSLTYLFYLNKSKNINKNFLEIIFFAVWFVPFLIIIPFINSHYSGALLANNNPSFPSSYLNFFSGFLSNFDLSFMYTTGDINPFHSTSKVGMYLLTTLPFFILGVAKAIRSKNSFLIFVLICFFMSPLLFGLTGVYHRASRLLVLVPFYALISSLGFESIINRNLRYKPIFFIFIVFFFLLNFFDFINDYWFYYPIRSKEVFWSNSHIAFPKLKEESIKDKLNPAIQYDIYLKEDIAAKFFNNVYFSGNLKIWNLGNSISRNNIILGATNLTNLKKQGFSETIIENTSLSLYKK